MTDDADIKLSILRKRIKTNADLKQLLHYQYYLGKWVGYTYVLFYLDKTWHKNEDIKKKRPKKRFKWF